MKQQYSTVDCLIVTVIFSLLTGLTTAQMIHERERALATVVTPESQSLLRSTNMMVDPFVPTFIGTPIRWENWSPPQVDFFHRYWYQVRTNTIGLAEIRIIIQAP